MNWFNTFLTVLAGFALRLAIPILVTALSAHFLRKLDAQWQAEYKRQHQLPKVLQPEQRETCPLSSISQPCWQALRQQDGRLKEACLSCGVFLGAPVPPKY
jgi:hypothetical protein